MVFNKLIDWMGLVFRNYRLFYRIEEGGVLNILYGLKNNFVLVVLNIFKIWELNIFLKFENYLYSLLNIW